MTTTITVVDGNGVQQSVNSLPPLGFANTANSLPVVDARVEFTALSANTAIDARSYKSMTIFCQTGASSAYTIQYSVDGTNWFNYPLTFGSVAGLSLPLTGGFFYQITAGTGGSFFYNLA